MMSYNTLFVASLLCASSSAVFIEFFGEDLNPDGSTNGVTPLAPPFVNSDAARDDFLDLIKTPDTESFESFAVGTAFNTDNPIPPKLPSLDLSFMCTDRVITATITGRGSIQSAIAANGQYPIEGDNYLRSSANAFMVSFSEPVGAFGFYGVDIGDLEGELTLVVAAGMGAPDDFAIEQDVAVESGSVLFFGLVQTDAAGFDKVTFTNSESNDGFAFDLFTIACPEQIRESAPPSEAPSEPVLCGQGITSDDGAVCCCASCGICGGCDCADLPGGAESCCPNTIASIGVDCVLTSDCGCVLDDLPPDVFNEKGVGCPE